VVVKSRPAHVERDAELVDGNAMEAASREEIRSDGHDLLASPHGATISPTIGLLRQTSAPVM
jgi:hypothetical protein